MGFFKKLILFSAFVVFALGGYLYFVASEAPSFYLFGDLKNDATLLFVLGGILIIAGIIIGLMTKTSL